MLQERLLKSLKDRLGEEEAAGAFQKPREASSLTAPPDSRRRGRCGRAGGGPAEKERVGSMKEKGLLNSSRALRALMLLTSPGCG